jgi:hypothetical protein
MDRPNLREPLYDALFICLFAGCLALLMWAVTR